jgi:hypothetical protein
MLCAGQKPNVPIPKWIVSLTVLASSDNPKMMPKRRAFIRESSLFASSVKRSLSRRWLSEACLAASAAADEAATLFAAAAGG